MTTTLLFRRTVPAIVATCVALMVSAIGLQAQAQETGRAYAAEDWQAVGGDAASSRHSTLAEISTDTVDRLGGAWVTRLDGGASSRSTPVVKDGVLYTPDLSASILPGLTRDAVVTIARELGYEVRAKQLIRTDLYAADELFMTGTAAEVTPIRSVDDIMIGEPGPLTKALQQTYLDVVRGRDDRWSQWLEYSPAIRTQAAGNATAS